MTPAVVPSRSATRSRSSAAATLRTRSIRVSEGSARPRITLASRSFRFAALSLSGTPISSVTMADALDSALDRLYGVGLDEFTATRDTLAKELKGDHARMVKALKKPNIAAWALNQLSRHDALAGLFEATEKLRRAQRRVMSGGKASELRQATDERNKVVGTITKRAADILE